MLKSLLKSFKKNIKKYTLLWRFYNAYYTLYNRHVLQEYNKNASINSMASQHKKECEPSLKHIASQVATTAQCFEPIYKEWCSIMHARARMHRKQWEFVYILEALRQTGCLANGKTGLGFGCGQEPMPAVLAKKGCNIIATDLDFDSAYKNGWVATQQHAATLEALNSFGVCSSDIFQQRVSFKVVNMNDIPHDLRGFDFLWSSCALEHLGSLEHGITFIHNAMKCLKPGGIAVHTTEFNVSSDDETVDTPNLAIYRKKDILRLKEELQKNGHALFPLNFCPGTLPIDDHVDTPPYQSTQSIKIQIQKFTVTSIGLIIKNNARVVAATTVNV